MKRIFQSRRDSLEVLSVAEISSPYFCLGFLNKLSLVYKLKHCLQKIFLL